jgi:hypothetical protein
MSDVAHKTKPAGKNEKLTLVALALCIVALITILVFRPF